MHADLRLKERQAFWETPRNIAILVTTVAAVAGFSAGGWDRARRCRQSTCTSTPRWLHRHQRPGEQHGRLASNPIA